VPYTSATEYRSITVQALSVTLTVDKSWVPVGGVLYFRATVRSDGNPVPNKEVRFYIATDGLLWIGTATTGSDGVASLTWTVPWYVGTLKLPCTRQSFVAYAVPESVASNSVTVAIAYPTRLTVTTDKSTYTPGETIQVTVKLEYNDEGTWKPLVGKSVTVSLDTLQSKTVTTGSDGTASTTLTAPTTPGSYTVRASYGGEGLTAFALAAAGVEVVVPEWLPSVAGFLGPVFVLAVVVATEYWKLRR
jgi:uncharacterized protein YfaS (alpha-2-macroglobulin family)